MKKRTALSVVSLMVGLTLCMSGCASRKSGQDNGDTSQITPEAMVAAYEAIGEGLSGENIAVKLSTGEPPASNYLDPDLIADFVVLDENGSISLPVEEGTQLSENLVGAHFPEYDGYLVLSHFKGHAMAGMGGAIKNISIGMASREGKCLIHTAGESSTSPWGGAQDPFLESMAEAGKSVIDALDGNMLFVSVMNHLSVDCDCDGNPAQPDMHDIGILASADPVALDQACVDLIYASGDDTASLWLCHLSLCQRTAAQILRNSLQCSFGGAWCYTGQSSWDCITSVYVWNNPYRGLFFQRRNAP